VAPPREVAGPNPANPLHLQAKQEIEKAWEHSGKRTKEEGMELGRVCQKWQEMFSAQGSRTGMGLRPILDEVGVPYSTAYFWIGRYKDEHKPPNVPTEPKEISLEEALDKLVRRIVMQPHGYMAAKFAKYAFQHPSEMKLVERAVCEIYRQIGEICKTKQ